MEPLSILALIASVAGPLLQAATYEPPGYPGQPKAPEQEKQRQWMRPSIGANLGLMGQIPQTQPMPFPQIQSAPPPPQPQPMPQYAGLLGQRPPGMVSPNEVFGSLYPRA